MVGQRISEDTRLACYELAMEGWSYKAIAQHFKISVPSVRMHAQREGNTADLPRSGRPRVINAAQRKSIKAMARRGSSTVKITKHLARKNGGGPCRKTVAAVCKGGRKPLAYLPVTKGRVLRGANKTDRVMFSQKHERTNWRRVVFIDSKYLYVSHDGGKGLKFMWQDASNPKVVPQCSNPMVFHFYGAVAHGFKSKLVFVPPTKGAMNPDPKKKMTFQSCHFVEAMHALLPEFQQWFPAGSRYTVVLDHARQHKSKLSTQELASMNVPLMHDFPAQSWDLNVIEVCWAWLDKNLQGRNPRTWDGWQKAINKAWDEVQISSINKVVAKVPNQLQKIVEAGGEWVKYFP